MCFKVQLILLLFGVELYYGHSITKIQIKNGTDVYEVNELPNKTVEFVNPEAKEPTLREIIYYRVIERPYLTDIREQERITKESDREEPDFDETLRPFTNSQGYQFLDWGAQAEEHPDDKENVTVAANNDNKKKSNDYYDEYDDKVNNDDEGKTKGVAANVNDDDYNSMEVNEKATPNNNDNSKDVYSDDYFDEENDKKNKEKDKDDVFYNDDDSNESVKDNKTKIDEDEIKANETVTNDVKDKNETNDHHEKNDKKMDDDIKVDAKNHTDNIVMKLRSQLFNSTKEKYHNIKRHHGKPIIVNRRKREINYKNLKEAPMLPDLDLSMLPDYLQKMLEKRLGVLKTNKHTDKIINKADDTIYNLPEPEIEIRDNFNDEEELSKNREVKAKERRIRRVEESKSNVDKFSNSDMKDKLKDMFDSIEDTFTKDGKKPRTYGMNLNGNTGEVWNEVAGAPVISIDTKDNEEVIGNPKTNEVDYDNDLNNDDYGDVHPEEPKDDKDGNSTEADLPDVKIDHIEQTPRINKKPEELETQYDRKLPETELPDVKIDHIEQIPRINKKPEELETQYDRKLPETELPDVKIDHIEQIPRINKKPEELETQYDRELPETELPDVKIDHIEQIPRINKKPEELETQYDRKLQAELDLPDLKIEHTEQIPRINGKIETTIEVATKKNEIEEKAKHTNKLEVVPKKDLDNVDKERIPVNKVVLPGNENLDDKIGKSFDSVVKQFKSLGPVKQKPKTVDFDDFEGSRDNGNKLKTYGFNLEGDRGYVWDGLSKSGIHVNVGNMENVPTDIPSSEDKDVNKTTKEKEPVKEQKEKDDGLTIEDDEETIKDENKEDKDVNKTTKEKEPLKEQKEKDDGLTIEDHEETIKDENKEDKDNDTKIALEDLLNKDEFWKWLSNWTTTYMEVLEERNEKFIKNEVARQLKEKNNDLNKNKVKIDDTDKRNNNKYNLDKKKTSTTLQNVTQEINSTKADNKEHEHENNKTLPYDINAETIYGSAVATDHVTNIFIFYPETENESMKKAPVLDKDKSGVQSKKVRANVTFDERLGSNDDDLKESDDATTKSPNVNNNNTDDKVSNDLKITATGANNKTTTEATTINGLTTTEVNNSNTETTTAETATVVTEKDAVGLTTTTQESTNATETTSIVIDKNATDGLSTTEVNNSGTETTIGIETTTVVTDKDETVTTESLSKDPTEASTDTTVKI